MLTQLGALEREGKIKSIRTDGGHRRYKLADFVEQAVGKTIAYARVSSHDQKSDLDRQDAVLSAPYRWSCVGVTK